MNSLRKMCIRDRVNIPFIPAINQKAISSTNLAKNYVSGMYELNNDAIAGPTPPAVILPDV